jgi:Haem-binding uptake, Tiki superfamily, ChaN
MVNAQVARDVWMAKTIRENSSHGLILLAGNGHVRKDIGVYRWLGSAERARTQVIGYTEEERTISGGPEASVFDRTIRIEPFERTDPCEAFTGRAKIQT